MQHTLTMRYPAAWHGDMWREGAPFGSGIVGGLVYGSLWKEYICINHVKLWRGGKNSPLPDVHDKLPLVRQYLDDHNPREADWVLTTALREAGYDGRHHISFPGLRYPSFQTRKHLLSWVSP